MNTITPEALGAWLAKLARSTMLIAPRDVDGTLLYRPVAQGNQVVLEGTRPVLSIKEVFFPATERLLTIERMGQQVALSETLPEGAQVVFGIRPCDARGVQHLDAVFIADQPSDPYYARRRENTTLVGVACREMGAACFCTSVGGAPDDPRGMDVMLYPGNTGYLVQVVTEKGRAFLMDNPLADEQTYLKAEDVPPADYRYQPVERVPVPQRSTWQAHFDDAYWDQIADRCLSCRICAYVCPTCRCFDLRDEPLTAGNGQQRYERIRCWDSCAGEVYRRVAGGHNPRAAKAQRLRNRILCKFDYFPKQYSLETSACTGCGRCIEACPVDVDITEVMEHFAEVA
jgi:sulfhydrogenase subunit beta (sulfur reductase)